MLSLGNLINSTLQLRQGFRTANKPQIRKIAPLPLNQALVVQARVDALTDKRASSYTVTILFHGLNFTPVRKTSKVPGFWNALVIEILPGKYAQVTSPSRKGTPCQVSCTCRDFYYTWFYYTKGEGSFRPPVNFPAGFKNVPPKGIRNPVAAPGVCKHIYELTYHMGQRGFLKS